MASLLTRPFRRAAGAGPLWRRRRSLPNSAGPSSKERQGVNPLLAPSAFPMIFLKNSWAAKVPPAQDDSQFIAHDYGAVMAVSAGTRWDTLILLKTLAFLKTTEPIFASFKRNTPQRVVAVDCRGKLSREGSRLSRGFNEAAATSPRKEAWRLMSDGSAASASMRPRLLHRGKSIRSWRPCGDDA